MKKIILIVLCLLLVKEAKTSNIPESDSLTIKIDSLRKRQIAKERDNYCCKKVTSDSFKKYLIIFKKKVTIKNFKMVENNSLDGYIDTVFNKVVIGEDGVIKNGSAANLSVDDKKAELSLAYSVKLGKSDFLNIGVKTSILNNEHILLNKDGNKLNGLQLNLKWSTGNKHFLLRYLFAPCPFSRNNFRNSGFSDSLPCAQLQTKRKYYVSKLFKDYEEKCKDIKSSNSVKKRLDTMIMKIKDSLMVEKNDYSTQDIYAVRDSLKKVIEECSCLRDSSSNKFYDKFVNKKIVQFEIKNAEWTGYSIYWWDLDFGAKFESKYLIYDTSRINTDSISDQKLYPKLKIGMSWNYARSRTKGIWFLSISGGIQNLYLLEGKETVDSIKFNNISEYNEGNKPVYNVGKLENFDDWRFAPYLSVLNNFFFGPKKMFGIEAYSELQARWWEGSTNKYMLNARLGFLLNFSEISDSKLPTFGIFGRIIDYTFDRKLISSMDIGVRAGIPFGRILKK